MSVVNDVTHLSLQPNKSNRSNLVTRIYKLEENFKPNVAVFDEVEYRVETWSPLKQCVYQCVIYILLLLRLNISSFLS